MKYRQIVLYSLILAAITGCSLETPATECPNVKAVLNPNGELNESDTEKSKLSGTCPSIDYKCITEDPEAPYCIECRKNETVCSQRCVDIQTSSLHCGKCGNECASEKSCKNGKCVEPDEWPCKYKDKSGAELLLAEGYEFCDVDEFWGCHNGQMEQILVCASGACTPDGKCVEPPAGCEGGRAHDEYYCKDSKLYQCDDGEDKLIPACGSNPCFWLDEQAVCDKIPKDGFTTIPSIWDSIDVFIQDSCIDSESLAEGLHVAVEGIITTIVEGDSEKGQAAGFYMQTPKIKQKAAIFVEYDLSQNTKNIKVGDAVKVTANSLGHVNCELRIRSKKNDIAIEKIELSESMEMTDISLNELSADGYKNNYQGMVVRTQDVIIEQQMDKTEGDASNKACMPAGLGISSVKTQDEIGIVTNTLWADAYKELEQGKLYHLTGIARNHSGCIGLDIRDKSDILQIPDCRDKADGKYCETLQDSTWYIECQDGNDTDNTRICSGDTPVCSYILGGCFEEGKCGDKRLDLIEECEGDSVVGAVFHRNIGTCKAYLNDPNATGRFTCNPDTCKIEEDCHSPVCGNGVKEPGSLFNEECDKEDFGGLECKDILQDPGATGKLKCTPECGLDASECVPSKCTEMDMRCFGNILQYCDANGVWQDSVDCSPLRRCSAEEFTCLEAEKNDCIAMDGTKVANDTEGCFNVYTSAYCSDGQWFAKQECEIGCGEYLEHQTCLGNKGPWKTLIAAPKLYDINTYETGLNETTTPGIVGSFNYATTVTSGALNVGPWPATSEPAYNKDYIVFKLSQEDISWINQTENVVIHTIFDYSTNGNGPNNIAMTWVINGVLESSTLRKESTNLTERFSIDHKVKIQRRNIKTMELRILGYNAPVKYAGNLRIYPLTIIARQATNMD